MLPVITVDYTKCTDALACGECLRVCPTQVLNLYCDALPQKFKETDPSACKVVGVHLPACSLCMECIRVCPEGAIQIAFGEGEEQAIVGSRPSANLEDKGKSIAGAVITERQPTWYRPCNLMKLQYAGEPMPFDVDRGLVAEVSAQWDVSALVESVKGEDEESVRAVFARSGAELMRLTMELADTKYLDRAAEVIERVYKQTGVSFPHRFERYVELALIASRPLDKWNVVRATTKELMIQIYSCALRQAMEAQGLNYKKSPCQAFCLSGFELAAEKTGDSVKMEMTKTLPQNKMCEFLFTLQSSPAKIKA